MLARLHRVVLVLLVCILPVQSMAAALVTLTCAPQDAHHAAAVQAPVHAHGDHAHDDGSAAGHDHAPDGHGHLCCHQFASAAPSVHALATPHDFRAYTAVVPLLAPLHIPELPQRPPRA